MSKEICVLCKHSTNDDLRLGEKHTFDDVTAHYYCLLLTSNLIQNGDDNDGILGFMPDDIKSEVRRTQRLFCTFCNQRGASIGCGIGACRKSFHLPCALKACRFEFTDPFRSFCDLHHGYKKPDNIHKPSDLCTICFDEMGEYNLIESIPSTCCNENSWYHKWCLARYAQTSGYFLKCPLCNDSDKFRSYIVNRGVFIPERDAQWEDLEQNSFYGFLEHSERPDKCEAKTCKCSKGRTYDSNNEKSKHSLVFCDHCGSHCVHRICMHDKQFLCTECELIEKNKQTNGSTSNSTNVASSSTNGNHQRYRTSNDRSETITTNDADKDRRERILKWISQSETFSIDEKHVSRCNISLCRIDMGALDSNGRIDLTKLKSEVKKENSCKEINQYTPAPKSATHHIEQPKFIGIVKNKKIKNSIDYNDESLMLDINDNSQGFTSSNIEAETKLQPSMTASSSRQIHIISDDDDDVIMKQKIRSNKRKLSSSTSGTASSECSSILKSLNEPETKIKTMKWIWSSGEGSSCRSSTYESTPSTISQKSEQISSSDDSIINIESPSMPMSRKKNKKSIDTHAHAIFTSELASSTSAHVASANSTSISGALNRKSSKERLISISDVVYDKNIDYAKQIHHIYEKSFSSKQSTSIRNSITESIKCETTFKKRHSIRSYFRDTSSSGEEGVPLSISPKKQRSRKRSFPTTPPNQRTIKDMFKKCVNNHTN